MKLLGFETTDSVASVALYCDGTVDEAHLTEDKRHAESVLPAAEQLLRKHGLTTADMDAFAVDIGPGSFTGVRIGVCLANALGMAHQKPVIAVNSLETLAEPHLDLHTPVCALIDARNGNGYGAVYQESACLVEPIACEIESFLKLLPKECAFTGTACKDGALPTAGSIVRLAVNRTGQKQVSPMYLKPSQAERLQKHD